MQEETPIVSKDLLDLLICPVTGATLELDEQNQVLINRKLGVSYKIRDGIPFLVQSDEK